MLLAGAEMETTTDDGRPARGLPFATFSGFLNKFTWFSGGILSRNLLGSRTLTPRMLSDESLRADALLI